MTSASLRVTKVLVFLALLTGTLCLAQATPSQQPIPDAPSSQKKPSELPEGPKPQKAPPAPPQAPPPATTEQQPAPAMPPVKTVPQGGVAPSTADYDKYNETIHVNVNAVTVPVTVKDAAGHLVPGLTFRDFTVLEDDVPQRISFFTSDPFPLSAA